MGRNPWKQNVPDRTAERIGRSRADGLHGLQSHTLTQSVRKLQQEEEEEEETAWSIYRVILFIPNVCVCVCVELGAEAKVASRYLGSLLDTPEQRRLQEDPQL